MSKNNAKLAILDIELFSYIMVTPPPIIITSKQNQQLGCETSRTN